MTSSIHHSPNPSLASPLPDGSQIIEEKKDDYPDVQFWNKEDWTAYVTAEKSKPTNPRADGRVNSSAPFIEDRNGNPVSATQLGAIRHTARRIWQTFESSGEAPQQWGKANSRIGNLYRREMRSTHPELRLCSNDWKSEALATTGYPSWYQNRKNSVKKEHNPSPLNTESTRRRRPAKRSSNVAGGDGEEGTDGKGAKRQKTSADGVQSGQDREEDGQDHDSSMDHSPATGDGSGSVGKGLKGMDDSAVRGVDISDQMSGGQDVDRREGQVHEELVAPDAPSKATPSPWVRMCIIKACVYSANGLLYLAHILRMMTPSCTSLILYVTYSPAKVTTPPNKQCVGPNS